MKRIGVFLCHCGINIAATVDVKKVIEKMMEYPGVVTAEDYTYMCSDPGQDLIKGAIRDKNLEGIVVAACSPALHELTFRRVAMAAGLNPYLCEIANIREQCSWVHRDREIATLKALRIIRSMVQKVMFNEALSPIGVPITQRALVIGGGISGMQAALNIANSGYEVVLVEKQPSIGGHMAQLSETFPTLDCSQCILTPKMVEVAQHPKIKLLTYSEVEEVTGYVGNFKVKILKKPRYIIEDKCNLCNKCAEACPVAVPNEFNRGLSLRRAIYIPFPQAIPATYTLDAESCISCGKCAKVCEAEAIDYEMKPEIIEQEIGAIVIATGYELYPIKAIAEYGYGKYKDVIDGLQFERLLSASGPTGGVIKRPSDGKIPKEVVFIQCVGSRDPEQHLPYCSKICCMYTAKHAMLYKHRVPDGQPYVFYMDIRSGGKGYEEFVQRAVEGEGVLYLRGGVSKIFEEDGKLIVWGADTLTGKKIEIAADMVVLATAMVSNDEAKKLAAKLKINVDEHGFLTEAHPKLRPVESLTAGIFLAGCAQAPKDIPEAVAQASGAASYVTAMFSEKELYHEPTIVSVDEDLCSGCGVCISVCPYDAREMDKEKNVTKVNEVLCEGCGACVAACPSGAAQQRNLKDNQICKMVEAVLEEI